MHYSSNCIWLAHSMASCCCCCCCCWPHKGAGAAWRLPQQLEQPLLLLPALSPPLPQ